MNHLNVGFLSSKLMNLTEADERNHPHILFTTSTHQLTSDLRLSYFSF